MARALGALEAARNELATLKVDAQRWQKQTDRAHRQVAQLRTDAATSITVLDAVRNELATAKAEGESARVLSRHIEDEVERTARPPRRRGGSWPSL